MREGVIILKIMLMFFVILFKLYFYIGIGKEHFFDLFYNQLIYDYFEK